MTELLVIRDEPCSRYEYELRNPAIGSVITINEYLLYQVVMITNLLSSFLGFALYRQAHVNKYGKV